MCSNSSVTGISVIRLWSKPSCVCYVNEQIQAAVVFCIQKLHDSKFCLWLCLCCYDLAGVPCRLCLLMAKSVLQYVRHKVSMVTLKTKITVLLSFKLFFVDDSLDGASESLAMSNTELILVQIPFRRICLTEHEPGSKKKKCFLFKAHKTQHLRDINDSLAKRSRLMPIQHADLVAETSKSKLRNIMVLLWSWNN